MEVPEFNNKTERRSSIAGVIAFILLFILVVCLSGYVYLMSKGIDIAEVGVKKVFSGLIGAQINSDEDTKPISIEYDVTSHPVFCTFDNALIKCTGDHVTGLDKDGKEVWSVPVNINNPLLKTNGSELLVTGIGSKEIYVIKGKSIKWSAKFEDNILNAHISEDGYVTVVCEAKGYRGQVKVFDSSGIEMFKRFIAENFVVSAEVSPSGNQFLINCIDASGIEAVSYIDFFNVKEIVSGQKQPVAGMKFNEKDIFPFIWQLDDDSFFTVGSSNVIYVDKDRNKKWTKEYSKIYSSGVIQDKYLALAAVESGKQNISDSKVSILNRQGKEIASYPVKDEVKNIQVYVDIIAVNTGREVHFVNVKGDFAGKYSFKSDVLNMYFLNRFQAAVVTNNSVEIITLTGIL
ncbi:MAG TPA: hypothetical protein GXX36_14270 [Clostridiaceae bacterium]|nr:hypothetical protein [Clostridiaceae bacterium]